ncbi:MAG: hypothetical protein ACO3NQ_04930 [Ilumatobacteraceae bacterium]
MIKSTRTTSRLAVLGLAALTMSMTACGSNDTTESLTDSDTLVLLESTDSAEESDNTDRETSSAVAESSDVEEQADDAQVTTEQSDSDRSSGDNSTSDQGSVAVAESPAEQPVAQPDAEMPAEEYAEAHADEYTAEENDGAAMVETEMGDDDMADDGMMDDYGDAEETEVAEEEQVLAEPVAADDGGDAATSNDQHRLTVEPDQAATGFEAVSYRDGIGDRGDRWSITASKDFFDSVTQSATMIIQIVCPEGGIWVHQGAVRDGYNPRSGASPQECSGAVTLTEFVGYQSNQVGFTVYLPDGVEGYFPYTVVASAA